MDKAVCSSWVVVEFIEDDAPEAALDEPNAVAGALRCQPVQGNTEQAHRFCILCGITEWIAISWSSQHIHPFHTCWIVH